MNNSIKKIGGILGLLAVLLILPNILKYHHQDLLIFMVINILVAVSYRLMTLSGEWSLLHIVMMGVGAYTSAMLTKNLDLSFWLALPLAGLMGAAVAALLCFPLFRMSQFYFLIGSFAAGESIRLLWIYFIVPFGGSSGINNIPLPELAGINFGSAVVYYYLTLSIVAFCLYLLYRIEHSRIGLTLHAVHWQAALAESVGINTWRYRSLAFILASLFVALAGSLKVHYLGTVTPHQYGIGIMLYVLIWVIVGGYNTFYGPIFGVIVLTIVDDALRSFDAIRPAIYGILLILIILYLPKGLESLWPQVRALFAKKPVDSLSYDTSRN